MNALSKGSLRLLVDHPKPVLLVFLAIAAALGWQATRFEIDASADTLLTRDNRHYLQSQAVNRRFAPQEFLLMALKPRDGHALSQQVFDDLGAISERIRQLDRVDAVRSLRNVPLPQLLEGGFTEEIDPDSLTLQNRDVPVDQLQELLAGHPIYENLLVNEAQTAVALQITFQPHPELEQLQDEIAAIQTNLLERALTDEEEAELEALKEQAEPFRAELERIRSEEIESLRALMAEYAGDYDVYLGGAQALTYQLIEIITNDLLVFGGAIAAIICLLLYALFRELRWVVVPGLCCAISVLMTLGLFGMLEMKATVISANFVALQLILTLAIVIHLIVEYRERQQAEPDTAHRNLVRQTLAHKAAPCFYAGITTSVGFATLLFSGLQPVVSFGQMMIVAVFVSIATSLALFPALLAFLPQKGQPKQGSVARGALAFFEKLALRGGPGVVLVSLAILAASVYGALALDVENSFINYFRKSTEVHRELSFIDQEFGGTTPLDIVYTIPDYQKKPELVLSAQTALTLQRVQETLKGFEPLGKILSIVNFTELAKVINDGRPVTEYELTAVYLTLDKELRDSLLGSFFSEEHGQARFSIRVEDSQEGLDRSQLLADIDRSLQELGLEKEDYLLTSLFVLYEDILQRLFESQILTLGLVFAALAVAFLLIFRSFVIAAIAIVPNILATGLVLGTMGWLSIPLDLMTITIAAVAMGIAVDDSIHYIHRYREEAAKEAPEEAVSRTHSSVGYAVFYTSVIIVIGFAMLSFSDFVPSVLFGLLTALSMAAALIFDLTLLPVLLRRFAKNG